MKRVKFNTLLMMAAAATTGFSSQAVIAEDEVMEEIVVTGSRIKRSDDTSISPISVFSTQDIENTGNPTLEDFLQHMPSVTGADFGSSINNGNPGYATASLRGLGPNRTLVLINGRRPSPGSLSGFVDLNVIPVSMIESIEVLRDGASAIYGSDAIAGVVNVITKSDFEGAQFDFDYQRTGEDDGEVFRTAFTVGGNFDRGNAMINMEYVDRKPIWQKDRSFSACPYAEGGGSIFCVGSGTTYPGHIFPASSAGDWIVDPGNGTLRRFVGSGNVNDTYNYAAASYMVTPQKVYSVNATGRYNLIDTSGMGTVDLIAEANFANRQSDQLMAAVGTFWAPLVPTTHPNNPFSPGAGANPCPAGESNQGSATTTATGCDEAVYVARRLFETGGRHFTQDNTAYRMLFGMEGDLDIGWSWDITYQYGRNQDMRLINGQINQPRVNTVLDPALCAADSECPGVWNLFARDSLTPELQRYILVNHSPVQRIETHTLMANLSGDIPTVELPGGPIGWAIGYERRREEGEFRPDGAASLGQIYFVAGDTTAGEFIVDEWYAEVRLPILSDVPFAHTLAVEGAVRRSSYDNSAGTSTNSKWAVEWAPIESVRLRAVMAEGFRAPSISELYAPTQKSAQQYNDPCLNWGAVTDPNIRANCQADGVPQDFTLTSTQATSLFGGFSGLSPEESDSTTFGIAFTPTSLPEFSLTIDYFKFEIEQAIGTAGTDNVITGCYGSANFSSPLCALMIGPLDPDIGEAPHPTSPYRNAIGNISGVRLTNANISSFETEGYDINARYERDFDFGNIALSFEATHLKSYDYLPFSGAALVKMAGKFGEDPNQAQPATFPEWRWNISVDYSRGDWSVGYTARFMDETDDLFSSPGNLANTADSVWYHDIRGNFSWNDFTFTLGVRNLADEEPPYVTNYDDMNTIMASYDTAGRYFYTRLSYNL